MEKGIRECNGKFRVTVKGIQEIFDSYEEAVAGKAALTARIRDSLGWTLGHAYEAVVGMVWKGTKNEAFAAKTAADAVRFFGAEMPLQLITTERVDDYIVHLRKLGHQGPTINRKLAALSKMLTYAVRRGKLKAKPYLERQKENKGRIRFLTTPEEAAMLDHLTALGFQDVADMVKTLIDTGMRRGELLNLQSRDVLWGEVPAIQIWESKGGSSRAIPMTRRVRDILTRRQARFTEHLFPHSESLLSRAWNEARACMGLQEDKQFIPYACRHTFGTRLAQRGVPMRSIQMLMGHKTISITAIYTNMAASDLHSAIASLERIQKAV